jgi:hypothetical protein
MHEMHERRHSDIPSAGIYKEATTGNPDPRTKLEVSDDVIDVGLMEYLHRRGILEAKDGSLYSRDQMLEAIRDAWIAGAQLGRYKPHKYDEMQEQVVKEQQQLPSGDISDPRD